MTSSAETTPPPRQLLNELLGGQAFERGATIARHVPLEVHLQLSSTCNLDCLMCPEHLHSPEARRQRRLEFLPRAVFDELEESVLPATSRLMLGVGGEALLCPDFFDYAERAHRLGVKNEILTNGTLIDSDEVARMLVRFLSSISISIDGATKDTYERIRRGASFPALIEGIERVNRYRLALPELERPHLGFCFVMMRDNVHELPGYVELAARLSADRVSAAHVVPMTPEGRAQSLFEERERSDRFVLEALERAGELGVEVDFSRPFAEEVAQVAGAAVAEQSRASAIERKEELDGNGAGADPAAPGRLACHMPTLALYVLVDGRVYPCGHPLVHQRQPLGDLTESRFAEIWNGRPFRNLRAGLATGDAPPVCRTCSLMHSPPPKLEDPTEIGEEADSLMIHYVKRDLAPLVEPVGLLTDLDPGALAAVGELFSPALGPELREVTDELRAQQLHGEAVTRDRDAHRACHEALLTEREHLVRHVANLERILDRIHGRTIYRALCAVKDLFTRSPRRGRQ